MDFLEDFGGSFLFYFLLFMVISVLAVVYQRIRSKNKEKGFRGYLSENFPHLGVETPMLMAKTKSKQGKPDIALAIDEEKGQAVILKNESGKNISHTAYPLTALTQLNRSNTMISRGFAPKTWSYEENLELVFNDGVHHQFYLENVSNRHGTDQGADVVRQMFNPWQKRLSNYLPGKAADES